MNYVDVLLIIVMCFCIWESYKHGFVLSVLSLLAWAGSLAFGFFTYKPISAFIQNIFSSGSIWIPPLSFIVAVLLFKAIFDALSTAILDALPPNTHRNPLNKVLGIFPGIINGLIWTALLAAMLLLVPVNNGLSKEARDSKLADKVVARVSWLDNALSPVFSQALNHAIPKKGAEVSNEKGVELPFNVKHPTARPDLEAEMLTLVNQERIKNGLNPVKADPEIAVVARKHSVDMFARGYFSHITPEGTDPFDRMRKENVKFLTAGENLALAQTLAIAHDGLMHSPGHRANILNPAFGRLGIGIMDGGIYGIMITQNFRN